MADPVQGDLTSADDDGAATDVNQNDEDVASREGPSRKMLRDGDSEDDLVENGLPDDTSCTEDSSAVTKEGSVLVPAAEGETLERRSSDSPEDPSLIERKVNEIFDIFDFGGADPKQGTQISDTSSSLSLGVEEPRHTGGDDSVSESVEISFEEHAAPMSAPAIAAAASPAERSQEPDLQDSSQSELVVSGGEEFSESKDVSEPSSEFKGEVEGEVGDEVKDVVKDDVKDEAKGEVKVEVKDEVKDEVKGSVREENLVVVAESNVEELKEVKTPKSTDIPTSKTIPKRSTSPVKDGGPKNPRNPKTQSPGGREDVKLTHTKKVEMTAAAGKGKTVAHSTGYKPGGGNVRVASAKKDYSGVKSRTDTGSRSASSKTSSGAESPRIKTASAVVTSPRGQSAQSKIGSMSNVKHNPGGGRVKIFGEKKDYSKVSSKIGSKEKVHHKPGGGKVKIRSEKSDFSKTARSKIGSLDNSAHTPKGGNVKIRSEKVTIQARSKIGSLDNTSHTPGGGTVKIKSEKVDFTKMAQSKVGSMDNVQHTPRGGDVKIQSHKLDFKDKAAPKVGSLDNADHHPGGGNVDIMDEKLDFKEKASSKIASTNNDQGEPDNYAPVEENREGEEAEISDDVGTVGNAP